mmetsp:Transcript_16587/g.34230  ORF Transcript_16587/g.34230 Transcript_16587/m.34230 type:complete len:121 (-) Transcript_16587:74-436(-)
MIRLLLLVVLAMSSSVLSFVPPPSVMAPISTTTTSPPSPFSRESTIVYGGKQAKFGIFSPAVYGARLVLGDQKLKNIRGKAISLHSGYIGDFCKWLGAYHLRTLLIKKAKTNGDILGFLV